MKRSSHHHHHHHHPVPLLVTTGLEGCRKRCSIGYETVSTTTTGGSLSCVTYSKIRDGFHAGGASAKANDDCGTAAGA